MLGRRICDLKCVFYVRKSRNISCNTLKLLLVKNRNILSYRNSGLRYPGLNTDCQKLKDEEEREDADAY